MFAVKEYNLYVEAQNYADRLFLLEQEDPEMWAEAALKAQNEADMLYDLYEYAAGIQSSIDEY